MGGIQGRSRAAVQNRHGKTEAQDECCWTESNLGSHEEEMMGGVPCGEGKGKAGRRRNEGRCQKGGCEESGEESACEEECSKETAEEGGDSSRTPC